MIKKIFLISAVAAVTLSLSSCSHHNKYSHKKHVGTVFSKMDLNKDGAVSKAEYNKFGKEKFTAIDINKDGKLCENEFVDHAKNYKKRK